MRLGSRQLSGKRGGAKVADYCAAQWQDFAPPLTLKLA
jgi:hypothetical protein